MPINSLKARLCLGFIPSLVLIVTVVAWVAHWEMEEILYTHVDRIVQAKCRGLMSIFDAVSERDEQNRLIHEFLGRSEDENKTLYWVWDPNQHRVMMTNSPLEGAILSWMTQANIEALLLPTHGTPFNRDINGSEYRMMQRATTLGHEAHLVFVAYPSQSLHDQLHQFLWFLFGMGTLVVMIAIGLTMGAVYWALRPVNRAADLLQRIAWSDTDMTDIDRLNVPHELTAFKAALRGMMARLNEFVDKQKQFTANAAHELRTPITLAKSTVQTAMYQLNDTEPCQQSMTDILSDLDSMAGLIDQLQRLSNLDEARALPETAALSLDTLIQDVVQPYNSKSPDRVICRDIDAVSVNGNKELLQCLFSNLIENALKHGPKDRPVLIQMQPCSEAASVCLEIRDEGGGIPEEDLSRLTERFYRVDVSRARDTGGSGLGLAIAQEITKKHKGQLIIKSSPGAGTCVQVMLPIV